MSGQKLQAAEMPVLTCEAFIRGLAIVDSSNTADHPLLVALRYFREITVREARDGSDLVYKRAIRALEFAHRSAEVPAVLAETIAAMQSYQQAQAQFTNSEGPDSLAALGRLRAALDQDPYLNWLTENTGQYEPTGTGFALQWPDSDARDSFRISVEWTPRSILEAHLRTRGVNRLTPEMALVRVMRDFDPTLTDYYTRHNLDTLLVREQLLAAELMLLDRAIKTASPLALSLVPTLNDGRRNLLVLDGLITSHFQRQMPEVYWQKILRLLDGDNAEIIALLGVIGSERSPSGTAELISLREVLDAPNSISDAMIISAIILAGRRPMTYPEFLLSAVPAAADAFGDRGIAQSYRQARELLDLAKNIGGQGGLRLMVQAELGRTRFFY
jgi:hypothetical protein